MGNFFGDAINAVTSPITSALGIEGGVGGLLGLLTGQTGMQMSQEQFNTSLNWEKEKFAKEIELANSAHQREIADLKEAGINPLLGLGGNGANTPSVGGVSPLNMNNSGQGLRDLIFSGISSALDMKMMGEQIKNMQAQTGYTNMLTALEGLKFGAFSKKHGFLGEEKDYFEMIIENIMYDNLIKQKQFGFLDDYGDMHQWLDLINKGTHSVKDVTGAIGDISSMFKPSPTTSKDYDIENVYTIFDKKTGKEIPYKKSYQSKTFK